MRIKLKNTIYNVRRLYKELPQLVRTVYLFISFFILLMTFFISKLLRIFQIVPVVGKVLKKTNLKKLKPINNYYNLLINKLEKLGGFEMKRSYLISMAYNNLKVKKARSIITILGMSVGVGIIVFLLSLGYGVERLIINQVASLEELKIVDVSTGENTALRLDKNALSKMKKLPNVEKAIPIISVVGRVSYNRATTDVLAHAVSKDYLDVSRAKLIKGKMFAKTSDWFYADNNQDLGEVAGLMTGRPNGELKKRITNAETYFNIKPQEAATVWKDCSIQSELLGYTVRFEGEIKGQEYWGSQYSPFSDKGREAYDKKRKIYLGKWIKARVPIYEKNAQEELQPVVDESNRQKWDEVCIQEKYIQVISTIPSYAQVLGQATDSGQLKTSTQSAIVYQTVGEDSSTGSASLEYVEVQASSSAKAILSNKLKFNQKPSGQAIISSGFLSLLRIPQKKAIGTKFKSAFIIVKSLMPDIDAKMLTNNVEYKIVGVTDDKNESYFYIPFSDMQKLGINDYSQVKLILNDQENLQKTRKQVETLGFRTTSTVDTVSQIETLFSNLRIVLVLLGLVALGVASLGMFNTLTVSLLERTREIGGMKIMGMVSDEVKELFLAEAMIMGFAGGIGGLILGYLGGKAASFLVSIIAVAQGQGYLNLTYIPPYLTVFILVSSFFVGMITGFYPAYRAKKISALDALRYE